MRLSLPVLTSPTQGVVIYDGPSLINGERIRAVVTNLRNASKNEKTGALVQCYILPEEHPTESIFNGRDKSVCGDCIHRYADNGAGTCYVNPIPLTQLWRAKYPFVEPEKAARFLTGRVVRIGAYGDPAAVPADVWVKLLKGAAAWTGYTHQWHRGFAQPLKAYLMASVETPSQRLAAQRKGWRTFRIRIDAGDPLLPGEFECPASKEQGFRMNCERCRACDGGRASKASPAIIAHGLHWKLKRLKQMLRLMRQHRKYRHVWDNHS